VLKASLAGIRTGRANPGLVDSLRVEVYGSSTPIKQLASVGAPESTQIVIRPYDPGTLKEIEKAIVASDLGFNPQNDGRLIRINIPPLSTEQRKKMVSRIKELAEEAKISIRNIRRDGNKALDQAEKAKEISEDQRDDLKDEVQELTKKYEQRANDMAKRRESEVLEQ
jgi:ribosome recycling factor